MVRETIGQVIVTPWGFGKFGEEDNPRTHKPEIDILIVENSATVAGIAGPSLVPASGDCCQDFAHNATEECH